VDEGERPRFDNALAEQLVGRHVLVGVTFEDRHGAVDRREQLHGYVIVADAERGVAVQLAGSSKVYWLPPDLRGWTTAPPGEYRLKSTGEVVVDPDYLATWTITAPLDE
jgi:hypothetical protein